MNMGDYTSIGFQNILCFLKAFMFFEGLNVNGLEHVFLYISMAGRSKTSSEIPAYVLTEMDNI